MKRKLCLLLAAALLLPMLLVVPACAEELDCSAMDTAYYTRYRGQGRSLNVYNWGEYISDGSDDSIDVNRAFEELTGIKVVYSTFDTNESLYAKLKTGGSSYDVIIPSDYMIARMIEEEMLLPLDLANIPNFEGAIGERYKNPMYDPENRYSVPYTWGTVGLIYNTTMVDESDLIDSWSYLWDPVYAGNMLMFSNSKDAFGIAFKMLGYPINAESREQLDRATQLLKEQKPLLQAYVMDEIFDKMTGGEAALAPYYAGDAVTMMEDNPDLRFVIPKEGSNIFTDAMCIPKEARNKELAEMYINFMLEPEVGLANIDYIGYSTPNDWVYQLLDDEVKNDPVRYPDQELLEGCEYFVNLPPELAAYMDEKWTELLSADERYSRMLMPLVMLGCVIATVVLNTARAVRKSRGGAAAGRAYP
ncbi:MAG: ABC transporter substrate-binding protein [Angelakisella sp.]|jgi:spermidine/putrescine transport system substrate-binding protein|nr:ABC transporter substrate-binding protein [Angelakisella sp.]MCI9528789.1 ABC transporter substrate-binding protein [Angelakisella sp.]